MEIILRILVMAFLTAIGIICHKTKIIGDETSKGLSDIALKVATPALLVGSFQRELTPERLTGLGYAILLSVLAMLISAALGYVLIFRKKGSSKDDNGRLSIERFSAVYSNCAFMGIPLINGLYGEEGVFYLTAFFAIFNIAVWTHGITMIKGKAGKKEIFDILKSPAIISIVIGVILFLLSVRLPDFIKQTLDYAGGMTTPLGMIVAGTAIAKTKLLKALKNLRIYYICGIRLIIAPLVLFMILKLLPFDEMIMGVTAAASACPAAAICTMFAVSYNKDSLYAGEIFAVSTVLSAVTLPLVMSVFSWMF